MQDSARELETQASGLRADALPVFDFDTLTLDATQRFEAWRDEVAPIFDVEADTHKMRDGLLVRHTIANLGEVLIGRTSGQAHDFSRSPGRIARDGLDHILIQVCNGSGGAMRERKVEPGDLLIIDMGQPHFMRTYDFDHLTFLLPRSADPGLAGILERLHGHPLSSRNPQTRLLSRHLSAIWEAIPDITHGHASGIAQGAIGMMAHTLSGEAERMRDTRPEVAAAMKHAVTEFLEGQLHRDIPVEAIASRFNLSRSLLYRMFEPEGGVLSYIRERRLRQAYRKLSDPGFASRTIGEIAFSCGFHSEAHFSRVFRQRFAMRPRDVRADMAPPTKAEPEHCSEGSPLSSWLSTLSRLGQS
ncbi:MAG: AraC family transcriptional regulator [Oceanicaulis sp.]